ncbi:MULTISPECIES: phage tail tube protein [Phyllobacteriaceae]|jgi:Phage tail tube protein|uniref:Uncharacterized protein n=1 Tax=Mesorhizobium hungaricum TaxID=1566387 RepID=A0A1C2DD63_9HYPH|nr:MULTISPECIES: phage tail tube protein [Mesorhizobium]MBN9235096.1 hypothetical protein [Mesorhizobium sp.]OCX12704.1 hypothetical protein QV13_24205 [Mesorhizobium hungaricum]
MTGYAEQWNAYVAYKAQAARGTQASGAGALILPQAGGQGGRLTKNTIADPIIRRDAMQIRGRHGSQKTAGTYNGAVSIGALDPIFAALMRTAWSSADLAITQADMTSVTTTANTIVATSGDWIARGLRVGNVIRATGLPDAANNGKNLRITGLTGSTITVAETLVVNAAADTTFTITRPGRVLTNPGAGALVKTYFTVEEHEYDLDASEVFTDCVFSRLRISMNPDGVLTTELGWTGTGKFETKSGVDAPYFTAPTEPSGLSLAAVDATLRVGTEDILELTSFDITVDLQPNAPSVTGPSKYAPDVFLGVQMISMNLTALRKDLLDVADFIAETPLSLHFLAQENEASPADFFALTIPNFTYGGVDKSALSKQGGPRTVTRNVPSDLVGIDTRGGAFPATQITMQVSNAT